VSADAGPIDAPARTRIPAADLDMDWAVTKTLRLAGFRRWNATLNRSRGRQRAVIVMYHSFTPGGFGAVAPAALRWQLELIRESYDVVPLARLVAALANREQTDRMVALTVEDGYEDFFTVALPILRELGLPSTLFVPTGFIGGQSDWYAHPRPRLPIAAAHVLRAIDRDFVTIGSHSVHHRPLTEVPGATLEEEIRRSKSDLESLIGAPVTLFSYPFGGRSSFTAKAIRVLHDAGFVAAVTTRWETYSSGRELLTLPRISFGEDDGPEEVRAMLAGDFDWRCSRELGAHLLRSTFARGGSRKRPDRGLPESGGPDLLAPRDDIARGIPRVDDEPRVAHHVGVVDGVVISDDEHRIRAREALL
jgi:peptidoglycan/xylan/chitin deacetylase (PgdA/CDA1 family)